MPELKCRYFTMTSSNGNIFRVTGGNSSVTVNSTHKGQWRGASMFSLICAWTNGWVNNRGAGDLRHIAPIMTSLWCEIILVYVMESVSLPLASTKVTHHRAWYTHVLIFWHHLVWLKGEFKQTARNHTWPWWREYVDICTQRPHLSRNFVLLKSLFINGFNEMKYYCQPCLQRASRGMIPHGTTWNMSLAL